MKFVATEKMSKKAQREYYSSRRETNGFNTGTRTMKTAKSPSRAMRKDAARKGYDIY